MLPITSVTLILNLVDLRFLLPMHSILTLISLMPGGALGDSSSVVDPQGTGFGDALGKPRDSDFDRARQEWVGHTVKE